MFPDLSLDFFFENRLKDDFLSHFFYPWEIVKNLSSYILSKKLGIIESVVPKNVFIKNPSLVFIGKNCVIEPYSYIEGPCFIEDNCTIKHGSYIRENVVLRSRSLVGHSSEIKNSLFLEGAKAPHFNYVGDSILGKEVNLGAGVKIANYRLDGSKIFIYFNGKRVETELSKLGAILGDGASIGCNSVTNPGTMVVKNFTCPPCSVLKNFVSLDQKNYGSSTAKS